MAHCTNSYFYVKFIWPVQTYCITQAEYTLKGTPVHGDPPQTPGLVRQTHSLPRVETSK